MGTSGAAVCLGCRDARSPPDPPRLRPRPRRRVRDPARGRRAPTRRPAGDHDGRRQRQPRGGDAERAARAARWPASRDVPVAAGAAGAAARRRSNTAADVHGESGLDGPDLPDPTSSSTRAAAIELMVDVLRDADEPVTLVPTGPLTNVATLLRTRPSARPDRTRSSGWAARRARQPHAVRRVQRAGSTPRRRRSSFASGVPFTMVGPALTHQALATPRSSSALRRGRAAAVAHAAMAWLTSSPTYRERLRAWSPPLHDPCALALALDPTIATVETFVAIETEGSLDARRDGRRPPGPPAASRRTRGRDELDVERFWAMLVAAIGAVGAVA